MEKDELDGEFQEGNVDIPGNVSMKKVVLSVFKGIKVDKASGLDEIYPRMMRKPDFSLAKILNLTFGPGGIFLPLKCLLPLLGLQEQLANQISQQLFEGGPFLPLK
eukprot:g41682.t1